MIIEYFKDGNPIEDDIDCITNFYPVEQNDIEAVIKDAETHRLIIGKEGNETEYMTPASYLMSKVHYVAEQTGFVRDTYFPKNHLPTMLAAITQIETDVSEEKRNLTPKLYIECLAKAEMTTAHICALKRGFSDEAITHAKNSITLWEFRKSLGE